MELDTRPFSYDYRPGQIRYGRGCVEHLGEDLDGFDLDRAMVVTGTNVGANEAVMDPVTAGLGDRLVEVFDETTPACRMETAYEALEVVDERDVDVLVGVGAGSSLDIATMTSVLHARYREIEDIQREVDETGAIVVEEEGDFLPLVFVPTTLAGADLSAGAGIKVPGRTGEKTLLSRALMATAGYYDPALYETTPKGVLIGSAMNGFDKGIEALYSKNGEPITDATGMSGLRYLRESLPGLTDEPTDPEDMDQIVLGHILVQFGVTVPGATKLAPIHAFGHALRHQYGVQQGVAHGLVAPQALRWILESTGEGLNDLAEAFDVTDADDRIDAVVDAVAAVRDGLELPSRIRDVEGATRESLHETAVVAYEDEYMWNGPEALDPTVEEIEAVLEAAW
ncbi:MAG: iron-containing alcohol dehydrogenase family protein [Haloferacaceae archaeon]